MAALAGNDSTAPKHGQMETLVEPFRGKDVPASSRVKHDVLQVDPKPLTVLDAWKYLPFLAHQATAITSAFVSHHLFGPPKKSWGIEMTVFTTALRAAVDYSHLSNISRLRRLLNLGQILPTPKDGIVTPVTFRVKRRGLRGFLAEVDSQEDGTREVTGEWVVFRKLWRKMQDQHVRRSKHEANGKEGGHKDRVIFYLHGGAYYVMSAASHRFLTIQVSRYTECRVFAINYRLAPETRFPGALHDAVSGYFRLIYDLKIPAENIIFGGDSAGGGLCMATMLYLRDNGYPLPSGCILMSPWVDLTMSCNSWDTNAQFDYLPRPADNDHLNPVKCYLGPEQIGEYITHPYASPLFGDLSGLPPMLIQCGDAEVLRDEVVLLAYKASAAGVHVEHEIYEDCVHVFQAFVFLEASRQALQSIRRYVKRYLPEHARNALKELDASQLDDELLADAHAVRTQDGELDPVSLPASPTSSGSRLPTSSSDDERVASSSSDPEDADDEGDADVQASPTRASKTANHIQAGMLDAAATLSGKPGAFAPTSTINGAPASRRPAGGLRMSPAGVVKPLEGTSSPKRPRHHQRSQTEAYGRLPLRVRTASHPELRALVEDYERANSLSPEAQTTVLRRGGSRTFTMTPSTSRTQLSRANDDGDDDGPSEEADTSDADADGQEFAEFATPRAKRKL